MVRVTALWIGLAILLVLPLMAFAMLFAVGCACGLAAYHLSRQAVVAYQPMRKAFDPTKEKTKEIAAARKAAEEAAALQGGYFAGLKLTREQYLAQENIRS